MSDIEIETIYRVDGAIYTTRAEAELALPLARAHHAVRMIDPGLDGIRTGETVARWLYRLPAAKREAVMTYMNALLARDE